MVKALGEPQRPRPGTLARCRNVRHAVHLGQENRLARRSPRGRRKDLCHPLGLGRKGSQLPAHQPVLRSRICPPSGSRAHRNPAFAGRLGPAGRFLELGRGVRRGVWLCALEGEGDEDAELFKDALVDFKGAPCVVTTVSEKAEILQLSGRSRKAKYKDLQVVFPGPVRSWELQELAGRAADRFARQSARRRPVQPLSG